MSLDYHLNRQVSLQTETQHQSLYKWCLQEKNENGEQEGRDLIPFEWSVNFHSTSFGIERSIASETRFRFEKEIEEEENNALKFTQTDVIFADLKTGYYNEDDWLVPSISMIGTDRKIETMKLYIRRIENVENETCNVWGSVGYDFDIDFRNEKTDDYLTITFYLENKKFDDFFNLIQKNEIDLLFLRLGNVSGFYSDWSPSISTDEIKILSSLKDQKLEVDDDWEKRIPTLGKVGDASLSVRKTSSANIPITSSDDDTENWLDDDDDNDAPSAAIDTVLSKEDLQHKFYERALSRISKLLGVLIIIEIVRAIAS